MKFLPPSRNRSEFVLRCCELTYGLESSDTGDRAQRPEPRELIKYKGTFRRNLLNYNSPTEFCGYRSFSDS